MPGLPRPAAPAHPAVRGPSGPAAIPSGPAAILPPRQAPPLRLTRRGRVLAAISGVLLAGALSLLAAGAARAASHGGPSRTAHQGLAQVVVRPGQSLWSVAESADPQADTRLVIQQIIALNSLPGDVILAGQRLWVPRG